MGVKERKEKERQQRIALILKAAEKVFAIKGMDSATVNDVAELAELGKGTLYLYFSSKDEIVFALAGNAIDELFKKFNSVTKKHQKGIEKLTAMGVAYMDFCRKNPIKYQLINFYRVQPMKHNSQNETPFLLQCHLSSQKLFELMIQTIMLGQEDRSISPHIDPFQTALILWATTTGVYQMINTMGDHLMEDHQISEDSITKMYYNLIENTLRTFKP